MIIDHDRYMDEIGAYLLGALSADEVDVLERHLEICQECRRELARLRTAAALGDPIGDTGTPTLR